MKEKSNKWYVLYCILAVTIFLCGCGNDAVGGQQGKEIKQEEITYVTQQITLPEYASFDGAWSDGNDLYYAAAQYDEASGQYETAFYALKQGAVEPTMIFPLAENQRVQSMTMDGSGNIYCLGYEEAQQDDRTGQIGPDFILYKLDQKGTLLLTLDLAEYTKGQAVVQGMAVDGENRIMLFTSNQDICVLDPDGRPLFEIKAVNGISNICSSNGKVFVGYVDGNGMVVKEINIPDKKLSEKLTDNIPGVRFNIAAGRNGNLLIASEESVYQYNLESTETSKKLDWQTYDFTGTTASILLPFGENGVLVISRDYGVFPMQAEATAFREMTEGEAAPQEKTVLTLGIPDNLQLARRTTLNEQVGAFNKANPDVKIEVKSYEEDYTRLNAEIMAGTGPDMLAMPFYGIDQLAKNGAVEDLNPYFDKDETLDRSDFFENILDAFESKGHLYGMPVTFTIHTMIGKTSLLGEKSGWDLDELISFADSFPEGTAIFDNTSKSGVLRLLKYAYTDQLVDTNNTSNPLNRELLVKMLEFANQYENNDRYVQEIDKLVEKILNEQVILPDIVVLQGQAHWAYSHMFGEPITFIGFPTVEGNGNLIHSYNAYAISGNSEYKDIAWKFISTLLSAEGQEKIAKSITNIDFLIRKDTLEYDFADMLRRSDIFASSQGFGIQVLSTDKSSFDYYSFISDGVKEEDVESVRNLIQNADTALRRSPYIDQIIEEEAVFYFSGIKPVEEVVDVIENRVRTYVNENK